MTDNILESLVLIAPDARFVKRNTQKVLGALKGSATMNEFKGTGSDKNSTHLVTVCPQQKSTSAMPPSSSTYSDDEAENCKARLKAESKQLRSD